MFNHQRDALAALPVWTTEAERRRALSYSDRDIGHDVERVLKIVAGQDVLPQSIGILVAIARYEGNGWMPDGASPAGAAGTADRPKARPSTPWCSGSKTTSGGSKSGGCCGKRTRSATSSRSSKR